MARQLLDNAKWFERLSGPLKDEISKILQPMEVDAGHCFVVEGEGITQFMIVESGSLIRSKKVATPEGEEDTHVTVDVISPMRTTGFLHVAGRKSEDGKAFATVKAGAEGAKVWACGEAFNELLLANPNYALEVIRLLSQFTRRETKLIRAALSSASKRDGNDAAGGKKVFKVLCYDTVSWVKENFEPQVKAFNESQSDVHVKMSYTQDRLDMNTASYAAGYEAVCLFVNDTADANVIQVLSMGAYSPYAVAEHAVALLMSVNRKTHAANTRVKMSNFTLDSGLLGMDIHGKTVGVMGTGKIGQILCRILTGFSANLLAYDVFESDDVKSMGGKYVSKEEIYKQSDIIFLMMPLLPQTKHTINSDVLPLLKPGVLLINTSRGGLIDTPALMEGIQSGIIGGAGLDVYENEGQYFFQDYSGRSIEDSTLVSLLGNNKIVMTAHQAFFTREAIEKIVSTTIENLSNYNSGLRGKELPNSIC
eukprot:g3223.t1 g3223   contig12:1654225-1655919(+)